MSKLLGMLPGAGAMKKQIENFDESEIIRTKSIVQSMTPLEREDPKVLNGSRRARIAIGAGRKVQDVNSLVDKFTAAQKMMRQMRKGGGMPPAMAQGMGIPPGMGAGISGHQHGGQKGQQPAKKKSKSGNPAKRAAQEQG
jgi:signal recognition particle subunit SRP54